MKNCTSRILPLIALAGLLHSVQSAAQESFDQVQALDSQDIAFEFVWSPFGQRTGYTRWGDDGSAIYADASGILLWQVAGGRVLQIPNSSKAVPLIVSNNKAMVWHNAFNNPIDNPPGDGDGIDPIEIYIYNYDPVNGVISAPVIVNNGADRRMLGANVLATAPITTTSQAYHLVTSEVGGAAPYRIYRLTLTGDVQAVSAIDDGGSLVGREGARVYGHGTDGTTVFYTLGEARPPEDRSQNVFWVDGARAATTSGVWEDFGAGGSRTLYTSATRVVYELIGDDRYPVIDARRNPFTGFFAGDNIDITPSEEDYYRFLQISTQTVAGDIRWTYALNSSKNQILVYRLNNLGFQLVYRAALPAGKSLDEWATVKKINPQDGSAIITSDNIDNAIWIGNIGTDAQNATLLPNSNQAEGLFVTGDQAVVWNNAKSPVLFGGAIPDAQIIHYQRTPGNLTPSDFSGLIEGKFVLSTPIFSPELKHWSFKTLEKTTTNQTTLRSYALTTIANRDSDGDRLPDVIETQTGTNRWAADTDGDGLQDGWEIYPYYVVNGSFTWAEAQADAAARGGKLAVVTNYDDYTALSRVVGSQVGLPLWLGATDEAVEGQWRWISGPDLAPAVWQQSGIHDWSAFYADTTKSIPWAPGRPNNANNADGLILRPDLMFEDRPLSDRRGYLIEYPRTDPINPDSDNDGIVDGDEIANGTNPTLADPFSGVPTPPVPGGGPFVPFSAPGVAGSYEGLIFDPSQGHVFHQKLKLNTRGAFSSSLGGLTPTVRGSFRGAFNPAGYFLGAAPHGIGGVVSIEMWLHQDAPGTWIIRGQALTTSGAQLGIEMRQAKYNSSNRYPLPGTLTMIMPMSSPVGNPGPSGSVAATGRINANGLLTLAMYLPDGGRSSFSGSILHGDLVALHAASRSRYKSVLLGPVDMEAPESDRDFGGFARFYAASGPIGSLYSAGYSQQRSIIGSRYVAPPRGMVSVDGFLPTQFNSLFNMDGGDFGGISKIGTWSVSNKISIPPSPTDSGTAKFAPATGLMSFNYTLTDPERGLNNARAQAFAVHIQRRSVVRGYYASAFSDGGFSVTPNDGRVPEITLIDPVSKVINNAPTTYTIEVRTPGLWEISVPDDATWVTAQITSGGLVPDVPVDPENPADPNTSTVIGNGNGTVTVTVLQNDTFAIRQVQIRIAGVNHRLKQDYRVNF